MYRYYFSLTIVVGLREGSNKKESNDNIGNSKAETAGLSRGLASLVIGMSILVMSILVLSSRAIVCGAVALATYWGLSKLIIGLTIVAAINLFALLAVSNYSP